MAEWNSDDRQTWFVHVCFEDIYHVHILAMQGTLSEVTTKVRYLSRRTGCIAGIHALQGDRVDPNAAHIYKAMAEEGMLLYEAARVNQDYASWFSSLSSQLESLPKEQRLAEAKNLQARLDKEIAALTLLVDRVIPATELTRQPAQEGESNERTSTSGAAVAGSSEAQEAV